MDGQLPDTLTRISSDQLDITVSDLGAEMQSLVAHGEDYLWHGDPAWWSGRSPILFPIVGKAPGDRVGVDGQEGEMAQHGFARRMTFARAKAEATRVVHTLTDTVATRRAYPKPFALTVTHSVSGATLSVSATVANTGRAPLPFGLGFHPAFRWPLPGAEGQAHEVTLANRGEPALARLRDGLLDDQRHPSPFRRGRLTLDPAMFDADAMIFPEGAGTGLSYGADKGPELTFTFDNLPNLALWQKPGAPFLCIEPWHGMAARHGAGPEIAARPGTCTLAPGDVARFRWSVTVR
ncbi:aldose 1-epimerase family protein [Pseudooceanicola onchidii]|uniref:aldose 1-epimerase family protein n=1 Tax=Pseudooceanicola onchidii TaxID=2562279 RepID=UPI0010AA9F2A|nr:aldose 1-epimerase family protein [Pseudooceanicola onchidii]